jgi:predicted Zn-dependent protease
MPAIEYSNPPLPEGVNVSRTHPLLDFARLAAALVAIVVIAVVILALVAERLASRVPFEMEQALAAQFSDRLPPPNGISGYLQGLADRLTAADPLPPGMKVTVHFVDEPTVNAFATLGGHVVVYRGLMEAMPHENALAMVIAHEIAHVRLRHPANSMGRGLAISLGLSMISAGMGDSLAADALGSAGLLTELSFSRDQELDADAAGLANLNALYGHVQGADVLFQRMAELLTTDSLRVPALFSTHPLDEERIYAIVDLAQSSRWATEGELTPFPEAIRVQLPSMASEDDGIGSPDVELDSAAEMEAEPHADAAPDGPMGDESAGDRVPVDAAGADVGAR